ncbi:univin-like [Portunus trituberculatus]|uniref:univin-like n=1 Tax=Portunus trituberculatus TaxID=210409 RepID=UPI001E1CC074|nr:univin-like [Portunus trituberculatus]
MRVISVAVVGALLLLLLLAALPRRAWARAAASLSPQALPDTRHGPRRPGAEGDEGVLAHAAEGGLLPLEGREQRPAVSHPHGPLHPRQEAPDHRLAQDTDEEEDDDEDEDEDDEEQDVEWSAEDLEVIKQKILDGLGLTTPPLRSQANITKEEYDLAYNEYLRLVEEERARFPDTYLSDEEEEDSEEDEEEEEEEDEEEEEEEEATNSASYRFYSTGVTQHRRKRGRRSTQGAGQVVHFHVAVPVRRVYHHAHDVKQATCRLWKTGAALQDATPATVAVSVYQMSQGSRRRRRKKQQARPVLLQTLNVTAAGDEWLSVDVTQAVREWVRAPREDAGVLVRCPDCAAAGVTIYTGAAASNTTHVPTLDVVTELPAGRRAKRSTQLSRATRAKGRKRGDCRDMNLSGRRRRSNCCRRSMKVRFKDLPDFEFIESPNEFDAFYCSGRCPPRYNPANEHALLQSLLKLQHKKKIPRPCCAPTALRGLHILHLTKEGRITTTYWDDMIVTACGCA